MIRSHRLRSKRRQEVSCPYFEHNFWQGWRPHGARTLRQLKFQAHYPTPGGGWRKREIAGPTSFDEWRGCWEVLAFAIKVLQASTRARLERYAAHVTMLAGTYPDFWQIVALADSRCSSENLERVRRITEADHAARRLQVTRDHAFWADKVNRSALLYATKTSSAAKLTDDGFGQVTLALQDAPHPDEPTTKRTRRGRGRKCDKSASSSQSLRRRQAPHFSAKGSGKGAGAHAPDGKFYSDPPKRLIISRSIQIFSHRRKVQVVMPNVSCL